jgi:hypothetical protein
MKFLFVDNFRGFHRTLLPIADVNFLVGENSTGKTSILALLSLLSTRKFWVNLGFDSEYVELGSFDNIVSINAAKRDYFRIGLIYQHYPTKDTQESVYMAFLLTFKEKEELPCPYRLSYISMDKQIHVKYGPQTLYYKFEDLPPINSDDEFIAGVFEKWVKIHERQDTGYQRLSTKADLPYSLFREDITFTMQRITDMVSRQAKLKPRIFVRVPRPFKEDITWLDPIRSKPRRIYEKYGVAFSPSGEHTPYLIRRLLSTRDAVAFAKYLEKFGGTSRLYKSIAFTHYGNPMTSPFELSIMLHKNPLNIAVVGYGLAQALPIIVELFQKPAGKYFAIQQPEIHLHPMAQVAMGELFADLAFDRKLGFLVETHSDFTIDGFRIKYGKTPSTSKPSAQILFFERSRGNNSVYPISILENGQISEEQPKSYRDFFIDHQMYMLGL